MFDGFLVAGWGYRGLSEIRWDWGRLCIDTPFMVLECRREVKLREYYALSPREGEGMRHRVVLLRQEE